MSSDPGQPARRPSGLGTTLLWIVLVLSVAGNAFFVGATLRTGAFNPFKPPRTPGGGDMIMSPRAFMAELSPATRDKVQAELRAHRTEFAQHFADLVASRRSVLNAMKADPFDVAAYRKALQDSADVDSKARQQAIEFFVTIVTELTPAERKAVAERLQQRGSKWGRRAMRGGWTGQERFGGPDQPGSPPPPGPEDEPQHAPAP